MEESPIGNPNSRLLHDRNNPMKKLQDFVLKIAEAALAPPAQTLLRDRLDHFVSHYRTPDHPPYSAMIQNALQELNEEGGSTKKSISQYLEKRYDNLPCAHALLLKHHLKKTCESGEIVVTRAEKYFLAGNISSKFKNKPRKKRRWRLECGRQKHHQLKLRFIRKGNKQRGTKVAAIRKYKKHEEKEQPLTENGEDQTKDLLSCVDGGLGVHSNPTILQNENKCIEEVSTQVENDTSEIAKSEIDGGLSVRSNSTALQNEKKCIEEVSTQVENDTSEIAKSEIDGGLSVHSNSNVSQNEKKCIKEVSTQLENDTSEIAKSEIDGGLGGHSNPTILQNEKKCIEEVSTQLGNDTFEIVKSDISEHQEREQSENDQLEASTPERPPGFKLVGVENLYHLASTEPEPASAGEVTAELVTPPKDGEFDSLQSECNIETPTNQEQVLDLIPISLKQMRHEKQFIEEDVVEVEGSVSNSVELVRNARRGWRRNNKLKKSMLRNEPVSEPSLTLIESESVQKSKSRSSPREKQAIFQGKQLRRSLRAKTRGSKDANIEENCPVTVHRHQDTASKLSPTKAKREESHGSSKSQKKRRILEQKPDVENLKAVDNRTQSGKLEEYADSMHKNVSKQKARKEHQPPERRSTRLQNQSHHIQARGETS